MFNLDILTNLTDMVTTGLEPWEVVETLDLDSITIRDTSRVAREARDAGLWTVEAHAVVQAVRDGIGDRVRPVPGTPSHVLWSSSGIVNGREGARVV